MAKKKNVSWDDVERDLKKYFGNLLAGAAGKIRDDLTQEAFNSMASFYTDWAPRYYKRHYYNFMENSFKKYYSNPHGTIYRGGVKLTPENMDNIYQKRKDMSPQEATYEVFETVYHGFHGMASMFVSPHSFKVTPVMVPSPLERIKAKRDYIADHLDEYIEYGRKRARKKTYSVISFHN